MELHPLWWLLLLNAYAVAVQVVAQREGEAVGCGVAAPTTNTGAADGGGCRSDANSTVPASRALRSGGELALVRVKVLEAE